MKPEIVEGDLLDQDVEAIVNPWNRNLFPWWLLLPQGVSGAIKRRGGHAPFRELSRLGMIPLGGAVVTSAGRLPFKAIIHVAGINLLWFATKRSIQQSVGNAMTLVEERGFRSVAFPLIGSGSGNRSKETSLAWMLEAFDSLRSKAKVIIVRFRRKPSMEPIPAHPRSDPITKKMLVAFDPDNAAAISSDFLVPVAEPDQGLVLFGIKSKKAIQLGMVIFTGKELRPNDLFARLVDTGRKIESVDAAMKDLAEYLAEVKNHRVGDIVKIERHGERVALVNTGISPLSPRPKGLP
jgi:O-acetyl-ADP-ribose deacetylase